MRPSVTDSPVCIPFPPRDWGLEFVAVEFGYERQARGLNIPSLRIAAGERLAIVGENGAGKSTLARLVTRLYDVKSGAIRIGGVDIREMGLKDLRRSVCYLPRDPVLFEGTLASNLRFVMPGASDGDLRKAIELADLAGVVKAFPDGLHQPLGPDVCQLSGGQRQRLAIARALLQKPRILILDEATSCLDPTSEALILRNLSEYVSTSTLIVVSHRASTLAGFGRVLVLAAGRIVADSQPEAMVSGPAVVSMAFMRSVPPT